MLSSPPRGAVLGGLVLLTLAAPAAASDRDVPKGTAEVTKPAPRVVVADAVAGRLAVHDARTGRLAGRVTMPAAKGAPYLAPAGDGRHVVATQYDAGHVRVLDGGSWTVPHGDHSHSYVAKPRLTPFRASGKHPTHVVSHGGQVTMFTDGAGAASVFRLGDLAKAAKPRLTIPTGMPHHGVAVPLGSFFLVTAAEPVPGDPEPLPGAVTVRDAKGAERSRLDDCPELHGEAVGDDWAAFGCADGVLLASLTSSGVVSQKIPYPAGTAEDQRTFVLRHGANPRYLVGDFGGELLIVDRTRARTRKLDLPAARGVYASPVIGKVLHTLTADGTVRRYHAASRRALSSRKLVSRFDPSARTPKPLLSAGAGRLVVSDPAKDLVHILSARSLKTLRTIKVAGTPGQTAVVGQGVHRP